MPNLSESRARCPSWLHRKGSTSKASQRPRHSARLLASRRRSRSLFSKVCVFPFCGWDWRSLCTLDRLRTVETLHSWQLLEYNNSELKLLYMNDICVVLRLVKTGVDRIQLSLFRELDQHTDQQTAVKAFLFDRVKQEIDSQESYGSAPVSFHLQQCILQVSLTSPAPLFRCFSKGYLRSGMQHSDLCLRSSNCVAASLCPFRSS